MATNFQDLGWCVSSSAEMGFDKSCLLEVLLRCQDPCNHLIDGHSGIVYELWAKANVEPGHQSIGLGWADVVHRPTFSVIEDHVTRSVGIICAAGFVLRCQIAGCWASKICTWLEWKRGGYFGAFYHRYWSCCCSCPSPVRGKMRRQSKRQSRRLWPCNKWWHML